LIPEGFSTLLARRVRREDPVAPPPSLTPAPLALSLLLQPRRSASEGKIEIVCVNNVPLFYKTRDTPYFPTLKLLHKYPQIMPKLRVDTGAIKFVLSGANIMCPGLTSPGATIHDEVDKETPVAIYAENKEHALAIGYTSMSTEEIRTVNQGVGVETIHCLNDGLWKNNHLE